MNQSNLYSSLHTEKYGPVEREQQCRWLSSWRDCGELHRAQGRGSALHGEIKPHARQAERRSYICHWPTASPAQHPSAPCLSFPICKTGIMILILLCEALYNIITCRFHLQQRPLPPKAGTRLSSALNGKIKEFKSERMEEYRRNHLLFLNQGTQKRTKSSKTIL